MDPTQPQKPETTPPETQSEESGAGTFVRPDPFLYDVMFDDGDEGSPDMDEGKQDGVKR